MKCLFVATVLGPDIGGTEVLIARMAKWLIKRGHVVTLIATDVSGFRELFSPELQVVELGQSLFDLCFLHKGTRMWTELELPAPDLIKTFDLTASWIACVLSMRQQPAPRVLFCNYMPYVIPKGRSLVRERTRRLMLSNLMHSHRDESILCMSREHIVDFRMRYGAHRDLKFWPLPMEDPSLNAPPREPKWGHIVSVGRLDTMKEYNLYMIDVVANLRQRGFAVTWTVYGEGSLKNEMKSKILALGLGDAITLKGTITNSLIATAFHDAYVFVGMGNAVIEAALCGVPAIVALAYEKTDITYGSLYHFAFGNVGERMAQPPTTTVEAEVERVLLLSQTAYAEEILKAREYARGYEMNATMHQFLEFAKGASPPSVSYFRLYWYYFNHLLNCLLKRARRTLALTDHMQQRHG
jgi:glycosyltransferase involved in cell wall biosynthesis